MTRCEVRSPWTTTQAERVIYHPRLTDDYTVEKCEQADDASPPDPCLLNVVCADDVFALIRADATYTVLSSEII